MTCASRQRRPGGAPARIHSNARRSLSYAPYFLGACGASGVSNEAGGGGSLAGKGEEVAPHGYFRAASKVAGVKLRPTRGTLGSGRVRTRSDWALPSNPPQAS